MWFQTENINSQLKQLITPFIKRLSTREEVLGIALLGGLGKRGFSDKYSDIDFSILLDDSKADRFPLPFEFHYAKDGYMAEFNINTLLYEQEMSRSWEHGKIEAYDNARIIFDPFDKFKELLSAKIVFDEEEAFERLIWIVQQYQWRAQIHTLRTFHRGYPEGSQYILNICLDMLIEAIFILNNQYMPHCKWVYARLKDMNSFGLYDSFIRCLFVQGVTYDNIICRLSIMNEIFDTIKKEARIKYPGFPANPYEYFLKKYKNLHAENPIEKECLLSPLFCELTDEEKQAVLGELCFQISESSKDIDRAINEVCSKHLL